MPKKQAPQTELENLNSPTAGDWGTQPDLAELARAVAEAEAKTAALQQQYKAAQEEVHKAAMKDIAAQMTASGITFQELARFMGVHITEPGTKTLAPKKEKAPAKYFNPKNPEEKWSGRGAEPAWTAPYRTNDKPRAYRDEIHIKP